MGIRGGRRSKWGEALEEGVNGRGGARNRIPSGNRRKATDLRRKCHGLRLEA
jgi:hypothetical protein